MRGVRIVRGNDRLFQSRIDGEYRKCARCEKLGYGPDAWHPVSDQFWYVKKGRLTFYRCRACEIETVQKMTGVLPENFDEILIQRAAA